MEMKALSLSNPYLQIIIGRVCIKTFEFCITMIMKSVESVRLLVILADVLDVLDIGPFSLLDYVVH